MKNDEANGCLTLHGVARDSRARPAPCLFREFEDVGVNFLEGIGSVNVVFEFVSKWERLTSMRYLHLPAEEGLVLAEVPVLALLADLRSFELRPDLVDHRFNVALLVEWDMEDHWLAEELARMALIIVQGDIAILNEHMDGLPIQSGLVGGLGVQPSLVPAHDVDSLIASVQSHPAGHVQWRHALSNEVSLDSVAHHPLQCH